VGAAYGASHRPQTNFLIGFQYSWTLDQWMDLEAVETAESATRLRLGQVIAALGRRDDLIDLPRTKI
jgi:hypothetical protein